jgi:predicted deacylase
MLKSRTIVGSHDGPHLLIVGGVHGDEYEPMVTARRLIHAAKPEQLRGTLTIVPCVNEAAFRRSSRVAEDGLDLARVCPGRSDGSITERAAYALSELIRKADYFIDLHTGGTGLRLCPLSGYMLHPNPTVLDAQRRMSRAFNLPIIWGTHAGAEGRSLSVARDLNVPAIYTETGGGGGCDPEYVDACVEGCMSVMAELGMIDRPRAESHIEHSVEDPRDQSGHLQIQHPSLCEGFFEPEVKLGDAVAVGQRLGAVSDTLGGRKEPVFAQQAGIILMLRWTRRVNAGDALAAILPSDREFQIEFQKAR